MKATDLLGPLKSDDRSTSIADCWNAAVSIKPIRDESGSLIGGVRVLADGLKLQSLFNKETSCITYNKIAGSRDLIADTPTLAADTYKIALSTVFHPLLLS